MRGKKRARLRGGFLVELLMVTFAILFMIFEIQQVKSKSIRFLLLVKFLENFFKVPVPLKRRNLKHHLVYRFTIDFPSRFPHLPSGQR